MGRHGRSRHVGDAAVGPPDVVDRLYDRDADEEQVGLVLCISERSALCEPFPRARPPMASLAQELG